MHNIRAVTVMAGLTFLQGVRSRVLWVSVLFGVALVALAMAAASVSIYEQGRFIVDAGLACASGLGSIMAVATTMTLLYRDLHDRHAYALLARAPPRWCYIVGRATGLWLTMAVTVVTMILATSLVAYGFAGTVPAAMWWAMGLTVVEMAVVVALTVLLSCVTSPPLAASCAISTWVAGHLSQDFLVMAQQAGGTLAAACRAIFWVLPDFAKLSVRSEAANDLVVGSGQALYAGAYGMSYALTAVIVASVVFTRRKAL